MKKFTVIALAASALALAGCAKGLPGSSLGATWSAENYLSADHGGSGFNGALASEYTELGRRSAFKDVRWVNSTAYIAKAKQAESGSTPAPWSPDELGITTTVVEDADTLYNEVVSTVNENKGERPAECARAQAMWDQFLEAVRGKRNGVHQGFACISVEDARAMLREAIIACRGGRTADTGVIVYFGFNQTNLTDRARETLDAVVAGVRTLGATALSVVGHTDTVGSQGYNQALSEKRARRVADALVARGIPEGSMTLAGRSFNDPAVATGPNVREPLNRRVEIALDK